MNGDISTCTRCGKKLPVNVEDGKWEDYCHCPVLPYPSGTGIGGIDAGGYGKTHEGKWKFCPHCGKELK